MLEAPSLVLDVRVDQNKVNRPEIDCLNKLNLPQSI